MSDHEFFAPLVCSQCGQQLIGASGNPEVQPDEMLHCPTHGEKGRFKDLVEKAAPDAGRQISEQLEQLMKDSGISFTKE